MQWTEKQLDVINTRNKNILVSAAAGSGKTAVLVERIIRMITDHDRGIDIDKLLVVTFTRAAAAEMKERIREALEEIARVEPENGNVQRQLSLLHHADISTIDSFCASVVKDNFDKIDLDPNFRIADETEIEMLQSDIIGEMLEEYYTKGEKDFIRLAKQYSGGKISEKLGELISQIYKFASGHHNPKQWVLDCGKIYGIKTIEEMNDAPWMKDFLHIIQKQMDSFLKELDLAFMISESEDGPKYGEALTKMSEDLLVVKNCSTYDEMRNAVRSIGSVRLSGVRGCNPEKRQQVAAIKKEIADAVKKMKTDMFAQSGQELLEDIINSAQSVNSIVRLTLDFMERFDREKKEKGIMDFNDQAHYALKILNDEDESGNLIPSKTAGQMAERYQEIMIDEYQDSNFVQEAILTSVSGGQGRGNLFMVGDVKQSIYRFRQAQPQLFLEKYNRYSSKPDKQDYKIILDKNFRSRREVVESVNYLFNYLMHRQVGGIDYKGENQLVMGAAFDEAPADQNQDTEFIIIEGQQRKAEAEFVAEKIKEITDPVSGMKITEPGKGQRVVTYGDIAILLRSVKGKSEVYMEHLENYGIPAYTESRTGYYQAMEVKTILSALSVIDNPRQDIPLTAVMVSPMFGFLEDELAQIRTENVAESFYDCVERYGENGSNDLLKEKTVKFLKTLHHLQEKVPYTSVYDLMNELLEKTGYGYYVRAMVNGERRLLNIEALKEKAVAYDAISYKGLFHFVRYIEKLKYLSKDDGEASVLSENDNTVHIMSIHKSKGLQYPIVFLCDTNTTPKSDTDQIVADENGIIGVDYIDDALKMKEPTIIKRVIKMKNNEEEKAEALRILYVALTRAKEKLYITGRTKNLEKTLLEYAKEKFNDALLMPYHELVGHCSFMDLIGKTVGKNKAFCAVTGDDEMEPVAHHDMYDTDCCIQVHTVKEEELLFHEMQEEIHEEIERESLSCLSHSCYHNQETETVIKENFSFQYPFMEDVSLHSKASVTEIKKQSMSYQEAHDGQIVYEKLQEAGRIPNFMSGRVLSEEVLRGAERGTAYHRVFELLDFERPTDQTDLVSDMIKDFVSQGMVTEQQAKAIYPEDIVIFTQSRLFRRMKLAWESGVLFRERKFLMEIPVREMNPHSKSEETMIVQGIIDVCFIEDGKYIIADYKTDKVENMEQLISRYKVQLQCYKQAIEQISGITVSEMIIYSVYLGEEGTI